MAWKKQSKYHARKTTVNGMVFDSRKEGRRYQELLLLQKAGKISDLKCQVSFPLLPSQRYKDPVTGKWRTERACKYVADYTYIEDGKLIVEDVKGMKTKEYILKRKMLLYFTGIRIRET